MPDQTPPPGTRRVVLTGAAGRIGTAVVQGLVGRRDLRPTDRRASEGVGALDVSDLDACRTAFAAADAVVHLAADPAPDATFDDLLSPDLAGPHAVARAAAATTRTSVVALRIGCFHVEHPPADRHRVAELEETRRSIGYAPVDDAWAEGR